MTQIELGRMNRLKVVKTVDFGVYLDGGEQAGEILLPSRYVPENCQPGNEIDLSSIPSQGKLQIG